METFKLVVKGSTPYEQSIGISGNNFFYTCTCSAGMQNQLCKHRLKVLNGDFSEVLEGEDHAKRIVPGFVETSEYLLLTEINELQKQQDQITKLISEKKKLMGKLLSI